jgi:glutathione S-transferase
MTDQVVSYRSPMSRGRMVHWMLEELGTPYRIICAQLG